MTKIKKATKKALVATVIAAATFLTSCDIMMDVLGGMAMGMSGYTPYYSPSYTGSNNNSYLLDPNYAIWQTQQQQAQMNQVQKQLIDKSIKQTEEDMERLNKINQQLIETSVWQAEHGINLGGDSSSNSSTAGTNSNTSNNVGSTSHTCSRCNGKGRISYDTNPPNFTGSDYKVKCNECGEYHLKSTGHTHVTCPQCKGTGHW